MSRRPISAVTVCIGYADFLREVAPYNRPLLDQWVVVTAPADEDTRAACRALSIDCKLTEDTTREGPFAKGRMIDRGLAFLDSNQYVAHVDADVALPHDLHQVLDDAHLDPAAVHGCDRLNVVGAAAWDRVRAAGLWCRKNTWAVHVERPDTTVGTRVANVRHGYTPIGFFQLWHTSAGQHRPYPHRHGDAARTDVQHSLQWDRRRRIHIPELLVWHLESERAPMGANWAGRTTAPFREPIPDDRVTAVGADEPARY